jgi:pimeloyl-ACP methyl ester carboxylesterase
MLSNTRLILLPGLAADERLFREQQRAIPHAEAPAWIAPRRKESLQEYAARWGAALEADTRPAIIAGLSMGGMVALEMARAHGAIAVGLMASCRSPEPISGALKAVERVGRVTPDALVDQGKVIAGIFIGRGRIAPESRAILMQMARECPLEFLRFAAPAITSWPGCPDPGVPVHHIHGTHDWVISRRGMAIDTLVPGGAHVLNMSHPEEVNGFLADLINRYSGTHRAHTVSA